MIRPSHNHQMGTATSPGQASGVKSRLAPADHGQQDGDVCRHIVPSSLTGRGAVRSLPVLSRRGHNPAVAASAARLITIPRSRCPSRDRRPAVSLSVGRHQFRLSAVIAARQFFRVHSADHLPAKLVQPLKNHPSNPFETHSVRPNTYRTRSPKEWISCPARTVAK